MDITLRHRRINLKINKEDLLNDKICGICGENPTNICIN